jgi:hypothetical protein
MVKMLTDDPHKEAANSRPPRRCLFGPPDPQETKVLLREQLAADRRQFAKKYNYDIVTFTSLQCVEDRSVTAAEPTVEREAALQPTVPGSTSSTTVRAIRQADQDHR